MKKLIIIIMLVIISTLVTSCSQEKDKNQSVMLEQELDSIKQNNERFKESNTVMETKIKNLEKEISNIRDKLKETIRKYETQIGKYETEIKQLSDEIEKKELEQKKEIEHIKEFYKEKEIAGKVTDWHFHMIVYGLLNDDKKKIEKYCTENIKIEGHKLVTIDYNKEFEIHKDDYYFVRTLMMFNKENNECSGIYTFYNKITNSSVWYSPVSFKKINGIWKLNDIDMETGH